MSPAAVNLAIELLNVELQRSMIVHDIDEAGLWKRRSPDYCCVRGSRTPLTTSGARARNSSGNFSEPGSRPVSHTDCRSLLPRQVGLSQRDETRNAAVQV